MRLAILSLMVICSGCSRGLQRHEVGNLGASAEGFLTVETWFTGAPLEGPKWQVCLQPKDRTNALVLFTVESAFQESDPGFPRLVITNDIEVVRDTAQSYMYSLASRQFITNFWTNEVYAGEYRSRP